MNPRELADVLRDIKEKSIYHMPWGGGPSAKHIALAKDRGGKQDWFPVSPALYETVKELYDKLGGCSTALSHLKTACDKCGIERGR